MSERYTQVFQGPALVARVIIVTSLLVASLGAITVHLEAILGQGLVPWRFSATFAMAASISACLSIWSMPRPHPDLVVNRAGLDWRSPRSAAEQICWDRIKTYALDAAGEINRR